MMQSAEIRNAFLEFFKSKGHEIVPSAPIVVKDDPTLLFTNAGMNQFKDYFLGNRTAPSPRVTDTQKCLRVSGKHNDLEEVGVDTYHHTMFEMLGNWSFGDYFKKEAIEWSWELLTKVYQLPVDQLYVTVFKGDESENLPADTEALEEWKKWIPEERILFGNKKDNFWEMGDTGPCGPCTEIHVDCRTADERAATPGSQLVNNDHPQVIEIWNNVFMQFNRLKDGSLHLLPAKHVDTGLGLERLVRVLQQKQSNYDTDLFTGTIKRLEEITGQTYAGTDEKKDIAFRVLSDHIRAICFTIADGQLPSNTGAGYVIRRILRRAVRYYYSYLNYRQPLLHQLVSLIGEQFLTVFPTLNEQAAFVARVVREEEDAFLRTLERGISRFEMLTKTDSSEKVINGAFAFELYDTFGFPLDLTTLMARDIGWTVDQASFDQEMLQQKNRSRAASVTEAGDWVQVHEHELTEFVGYDTLEIKTKILRYRKAKAKGKDSFQIVLSATPFYAESGGQVGDTGFLTADGNRIEILDTKKENDLIIHLAEALPVNPEADFVASVNRARRKAIAVHHSATHLLHAALKEVLGAHVNQKGSLVNGDELRFDFSHFSKVSAGDLAKIETIVNEKIRQNLHVEIRQMNKDEAIAMGAMALFGEKYGEQVRVVMMDPKFSIELCGGTHVTQTGELGFFKIVQETAVAAGVRRIFAVTGIAAENYLNNQLGQLQLVEQSLNNPKDTFRAVEKLMQELATLKKKTERLEAKQNAAVVAGLSAKLTTNGDLRYLVETLESDSADSLKKIAGDLRNAGGKVIVALASDIEGRAQVAIAVSDELLADNTFDASKIIKTLVAPLIRGGGGGQKSLSMAGGEEVSAIPEVLRQIRALIES
jgi:alanyl-tRNA synthetase